ncbi:rhodanese-like domain-containing protein [Desulfurivibrio sp. C05AmB]|uniref:rhodanese-like domain-containing protein n=1 Tax=Desulfurivibrio sp. C05AmB TaxID=3374371 RepID=UPI00376F171B
MKPPYLASALALLLLLFTAGCATTTASSPPAVAPSAAGHTKAVEQDPQIRITTAEVMDLFAKEFGDAPLIEETLKKNTFLLVDTRPAVRFQEGTVPGSINIPTPRFAQEIPQLPRDRTIIFFCGGLA